MLLPFFEFLFELFDLGLNDGAAVRLVGMGAEIVLMIVGGFPEFLERDNFGHDGAFEVFLSFVFRFFGGGFFGRCFI